MSKTTIAGLNDYAIKACGCDKEKDLSGTGEASQREPMKWRRFELLTESEAERERLERVLEERNISRRDLAIILFGLRVRPGFGKEHFGI